MIKEVDAYMTITEELKTKVCITCGFEKDVTEFQVQGTSTNGFPYYTSYCTGCHNEKIGNYKKQHVKGWKLLYGGKCVICGYDRTLSALCFHHTDPLRKTDRPGKLIRCASPNSRSATYYRVKEELDTCQLLCANCHIEVHEGVEDELVEDGDLWGVDT